MNTSVFSGEDQARALPWLCVAVVAVALPHAANLPLDVIGFVVSACIWRMAALRRYVSLPGRTLLLLLTIAGAVLVYSHFHQFHGPEAAAALLLTGTGLKMLELASRRDLYLVVYLSFLTAVSECLFEQGVAMAGYTALVMILLVSCLLSLNGAGGRPVFARLRTSTLLLAQAAPLALVLFLLVPRIPAPLWQLPLDQPAASSGLSDTMEPGAISRLGLSRGIAFRVDFDGSPPLPRDRYWRGPVFWYFDGRVWSAGTGDSQPRVPSVEGSLYAYTVTLEPHQRRWVFPLEMPETFGRGLQLAADGYLLAREPIRERQRYEMTSRPHARAAALSEADRIRALQLPAEAAPGIQALVDPWRSADAESVVQSALDYFRVEPFVYTLKPPVTLGDPVVGFLFQTRRGFCEHYAGAFVYLMRAAGVPARVVTGYQGGHWNPVGRFLEVMQADAHAWAEVWLQGWGWVRVDPTAAVAPERIEWESMFGDEEGANGAIVFKGPVAESLAERVASLRGLMMEAGLLWSSLDHSWHRWVLAYDQENQRRFLESLGISDGEQLAYWLAALPGAVMLVLSLTVIRRRPQADLPLLIYRRVARRLEKAGLVRDPAEGWSDFARRVAEQRPDLAESILRFTALFLAIRYGARADDESLQRLAKLARTFPSV